MAVPDCSWSWNGVGTSSTGLAAFLTPLCSVLSCDLLVIRGTDQSAGSHFRREVVVCIDLGIHIHVQTLDSAQPTTMKATTHSSKNTARLLLEGPFCISELRTIICSSLHSYADNTVICILQKGKSGHRVLHIAPIIVLLNNRTGLFFFF